MVGVVMLFPKPSALQESLTFYPNGVSFSLPMPSSLSEQSVWISSPAHQRKQK